MRELESNLISKDRKFLNNKKFEFIDKIKFVGKLERKGYFLNVNINNKIIISGWKIHLSPLLLDYFEVLKKVNAICKIRKINYKFIDAVEGYKLFTGKNIPSSQFGKIITIYPNNEQDFLTLLNEFYTSFKSVKGMAVPSDHAFKDSSLIYYRYGGINPILKMNEENDLETLIFDGNGNLVKDKRHPYFSIPAGIENPIKVNNKNVSRELLFEGCENGKDIRFKRIIRRLASGNIYLGLVENSEVIIKEAKFGALPRKNNFQGTAILLKKNEEQILKQKISCNMPRFIDSFEIDRNYFLVESKILGENLRKFSSKIAVVKPGKDKQQIKDINRIKQVFNNLENLVNEIHTNKYIIGDVSPDNFIVDKNNKVSLIDCETVHPMNTKSNYLNLETDIFVKNIRSNVSELAKDNYKLGMSMFWILTQKNREIDNNFNMIGYYLNLLVKKYPSLLEVKNKIITLIEPAIKKDKTKSFSFDEVKEKVYTQIDAKIKNHELPISTHYIASNLSFMYGLPGILWYFNYKEKLEKKDKKYWSSYILRIYKNDRLSSGLFFGKMGLALVLADLGVSFERNIPLLDLLYKLNTLEIKLTPSLANGVSGLLIGFNLLSRNSKYPLFKNIRSKLTQDLISHHMTQENGLEYGKVGILLAISFLKKDDAIFLKYYHKNYFKDLENSVNSIIKCHIQKNIFLGLPDLPDSRIIYPNLMSGGAGVVLLSLFSDEIKVNINQLLNQYDVPFMVNNGISYGIAGFIFPILLGIKLEKFRGKNFIKAQKIINKWKKYILRNCIINDKNYYGWKSDQGSEIHDDIGSGNTGILIILDLLKEVMPNEIKRNTN